MITPSFSLTAIERVLPKLALDFTTSALDPRITFSRTGATATRVNSSGFIESVAADTARFDFDPVTLACKGLLIEESRTNILPYSNEFDYTGSSFWIKNNSTPTATSGISPDGTNNAYNLLETTASGTHYVTQTVTTTINATLTLSIYLKQNGRSWALLQMVGLAVFPSVNINLATGQLGTLNGTATATVEDSGDGWWRLTLTAVTDIINPQLRVYTETGDNQATFVGDDTKGVLMFGAQVEAGAFATSYIPTTTAALTRNADVATMTGTNFSDWFNPTEGTFVVEGQIPVTTGATRRLISVNDGSQNNSMQLAVVSGGTTGYFETRVDGSVVVTATNGTFVFGSLAEYALSYKANNFAYSVNGGNVGVDDSAAVPNVTTMNIGYHPTANIYINGVVKKLNYYNHRLTNNETQAISN